jgi:hypothetical protein
MGGRPVDDGDVNVREELVDGVSEAHLGDGAQAGRGNTGCGGGSEGIEGCVEHRPPRLGQLWLLR